MPHIHMYLEALLLEPYRRSIVTHTTKGHLQDWDTHSFSFQQHVWDRVSS